MTTGIYKINFNGTDKVYIGQSLNIETRMVGHLCALRKQKITAKLQDAYNTYGIKDYEVILECNASELDTAESEAIEIFDSYNNGFNTLPSASVPCNYGTDNINSQHSVEEYARVLRLLVQVNPTLTKREIQEITGVSIYIIRHIASLESHCWLKELYPEDYAKLEALKGNKYYYGKQYLPVRSPDGTIYEVTHVTNFAKEHGLLQPKLTEVLKGTRNHHKGWTLVQEQKF